MNIKKVADRCVAFGAAVSAPVLTALVDQHVISASLATDVGAIVVAAVAAYHGGAVVQARHAATELGRS